MNSIDSGVGVGVVGTTIETALAISQTNEIFQMVQIVLAIISFLITILYTIYRWYKSATDENSDGGKKITKDEVKDLIDDIKKEVDDNDRDKG